MKERSKFMKEPLVIIAGATATGKSNLSIELSKRINGEIISADSMQVYKYMNIGTAKINKNEMQGIKHYLIDTFYPDYEYSVSIFKSLAKKYVSEIIKKGKVPILVGGTGFYINALLYNNSFPEYTKDNNYRNYLNDILKTKGEIYLHELLKDVDIDSYNSIHFNNSKRIIRALEFYKLTGKKISHHNEIEKNKCSYYNNSFNILTLDRQILYSKINSRVDMMLQNGLIKEVEHLLNKGYNKNLVSMQGIGYKQTLKYINLEATLDDTIELIKRDTRRFAKRQLTWFKHQTQANWFNLSNTSIDEVISLIISDCCKKGIIRKD